MATSLGPFVDCTSNQVRASALNLSRSLAATNGVQADAYLELLTPKRASLLKESAALAREILSDFTGVSYEELAVEISVCALPQDLGLWIQVSD